MLYVVESGQETHFNWLIGILQKLNCEWSNTIEHVKFGKIRGLSTRKGNAVFLSDILNEAVAKIREQQEESVNTKAKDGATADILATTAVAVNDLKSRRIEDYDFSWERALQSRGNSGIKLQYTHARLTSLIDKNSERLDTNFTSSKSMV